MFTCEQRDPQPGVNVSAETLETIGDALDELPPRNAREKKRKEEKERRNERKKEDWMTLERERRPRRRGTSGFVPGAYTIASPWRNNGSWMSHRVQSQSAISRATEFRRETTASPQPKRFTSGRYPFALEYQSIRCDGSPPSFSRLLLRPLLSPSRHNFAVVRIVLLRTSSDKEDSDSLTSSTTRFCERRWNYARGITSRRWCDRTRRSLPAESKETIDHRDIVTD